MNEYVSLHQHTTYSILDGLSPIDKLVERAKQLNMKAIAITDHGSVAGVMDMFSACKKSDLKFLPGMEGYFVEDRFVKTERENFHILLLAKNLSGWKNLVKISSLAYLEGFYYKPRLDWNLLEAYRDGLIVTSACIGSKAGMSFEHGKDEEAYVWAKRMKELFGDDFYIEVDDNGLDIQKRLNPKLIKLAQDLSIKIVAAGDGHYVNKEDSSIHDALLCMQVSATINQPNRFRFDTPDYYLKSADEMAGVWPIEYLKNTIEVAEKCNVDLTPKGYHLPKFPVPEGMTDDEYLNQLCQEGWVKKILKYQGTEKYKVYQERIRYELSVIQKIGCASYMLIVQDYVNWAKKTQTVGKGRGSVAGSLVAYVIGITGLDPIEYGLLFERFLNPDRVSMPDIDLDFEDRDAVLAYLVAKWGEDRCCSIGNYGHMWSKNAVRDSVRVLALPESVADEICKTVPDAQNEDQAAKPATFDELLPYTPELQKMKEKYPDVFRLAQGVEGGIKSEGVHASGVVIAPDGLINYVPLKLVTDKEQKRKDKRVTTQFDGVTCDKIGLMKVDVLGLKTLRLISTTLKAIEETGQPRPNIDELVPNDDKTFELLRNSASLGVFQLEGIGMQKLLHDIHVDSINDITATIGLFRPGPIASGATFQYAKRKHGEPYHLVHPSMEEDLKETYGVICYQEQMMQISRSVAGWTFAQADMLRKACGKMDPKLMREQKEKFIPDCIKRGVSQEVAEEIFRQFEGFGVYAFNKSHSACYAFISYQCAYLKAHYLPQFMCALLSNEDSSDKILLYLNECKRLGTLQLLPPDVNKSGLAFKADGNVLLYGLGTIKHVGEKAVGSILQKRPYKSFVDFLWKHDEGAANKRVIESLIKCGCFDLMGYNRFMLLRYVDEIRDEVKKMRELANGKRKSIKKTVEGFGDLDRWEEKCKVFDEVATLDQILEWEKDLLNVYLSGHPLDRYTELMESKGIATSSTINEDYVGPVKIAGVVVEVKEIVTKRREPMGFIRIEDMTSTLQLIAWPTAYAKYRTLFEKGKILAVKANYRDKQITLGDKDVVVELESLRPN